MTKTLTGQSGLTCARCGTSLSYAQERWINYSTKHSISCAVCAKQYKAKDVAKMPLRVRENCRVFLGESGRDEALTRTWFHATTAENWLASIQSLNSDVMPVVHLGTMDAATDRARILKKKATDRLSTTSEENKNVQIFLYTVRIVEGASCSKAILPDDDSIFPTYVNELTQFGYDHITRYLNRFESSGSISLIADPRSLIVGACVKLS